MRNIEGPREGKINIQERKWAAIPIIAILTKEAIKIKRALKKRTLSFVVRYQNLILLNLLICQAMRSKNLMTPLLKSIL